MSGTPTHQDRLDLGTWVKVTTYGWWLGLVAIILLALAADALAGVDDAQFIVGLGMGAGVGYMQGRRLQQLLGVKRAWFLASAAGMGGPFIVGDAGRALAIDVPYSLAISVAIGSLLAGLLQWRILRRHVRRAIWWMPASVLGWMLPIGLIGLKDRHILSGVAGEAAGLTGMFLGGIILGAVTGGPLRRMLEHRTVTPA